MKFLNFNEDITVTSVEGLMIKLQSANCPNALVINSLGGDIDALRNCSDTISRRRVTTVGREVYSAALYLFMLGSNRYVFPDATFFFHGIR